MYPWHDHAPPCTPPDLTTRQREVLAHIARGRTNFEIATELGISLETVKYHVTEILARLGVESREEAVLAWREQRRPMHRLRGLVPAFGLKAFATGAGVVGAATGGILLVAVVTSAGSGREVPSAASDLASTSASPSASSGMAALTSTPPGALPVLGQGTSQGTATPGLPTPIATLPSGTGPYPLDTRTGIMAIDQVLVAAQSGQPGVFGGAVQYFESPCHELGTSPPSPPGSLICPDGVPDDTLLFVTSVESTDGGLLPRGDPLTLQFIDQFAARVATDPRVYAILDLRGQPDQGQLWRYRVVFASGDAVTVGDEGIVFFACPCQRTLAELEITSVNQVAKYVLPPRP